MRSPEKTRGPTSDEGVKRGGAQEGRGEESARLSAYEDLSKLGKDKWGWGGSSAEQGRTLRGVRGPTEFDTERILCVARCAESERLPDHAFARICN